MLLMTLNSTSCGRIFWLFGLTHVLLWTLLPSLGRHEMDTDSMMHFVWGQEWMGSYYLHPPVLPWVVAGFLKVFGSNNWTYNLLTQLNFLLAFYCIWRLAREVLPPMSALAAVCLLEFVPYFSFFSMRLNHSSMLIPIWALTILLGYFAIQRGQYRYWIALGLISGIAMLTKYYSAAMLPGIALYLLLFPKGRETLNTAGPYLSLLVFLVMMGWHLWYVDNQQIGTVTHIGDYVASDFSSRIKAIRFLIAQLLYLLPLFLVFFFVFFLSRYKTGLQRAGGEPPGQGLPSFIYWMFLFPLIGTALVGFLFGIGASSRWGGPTLNLAGIVLLLYWPLATDSPARKHLIRAAFVWLVLLPPMLLFSGLVTSDHDMYHFPGKELGRKITTMWRNAYQVPLRIVGGGHDAPNSIAFHSTDHPSVLQHLSHEWSPWINKEDITRDGIAVICLTSDTRCAENARTLFPGYSLTPLTVKAEPGLFFPGSERDFLYFFVPPDSLEVNLETIEPLPMRADQQTE
jgi:4-amino-4-deoxy-L-arabinose transferase-like glycosyltransferase